MTVTDFSTANVSPQALLTAMPVVASQQDTRSPMPTEYVHYVQSCGSSVPAPYPWVHLALDPVFLGSYWTQCFGVLILSYLLL
jgi:hypothetical protein